MVALQRVNFIHVRFSIDFTGYSPDFNGFCTKIFCGIDDYAMRVQTLAKFCIIPRYINFKQSNAMKRFSKYVSRLK